MKTTLDSSKICMFNILIAEWLIAQKHKMHFSIINYQTVSQKRYHYAHFQNKYHTIKLAENFPQNPTNQSSIFYLAPKSSVYQVYPSRHAMIF